MTARFYCQTTLVAHSALLLPAGAARHVQVLRLQPGDALTLFDGHGGEYSATVERMGRSEVAVQVGAGSAIEREAPRAIHLAVGMPANERMDWLVEKATELGVASIQPLMTAHSVLRLQAERAEKKRAHWEAIAIAACEQCGRNRLPPIHPVQSFNSWLTSAPNAGERLILSLAPGTRRLAELRAGSTQPDDGPIWVLSGPEGGLSQAEEAAALAQAFKPLSLGNRVLRAETAALTALALLAEG